MKRTLKKAQKYHLSLEIDTRIIERNGDEIEVSYIEIYPIDADGEVWDEFIASYYINTDGSMGYYGSCFPGDHDMPGIIDNEKSLAGLLPEFARFATRLFD